METKLNVKNEASKEGNIDFGHPVYLTVSPKAECAAKLSKSFRFPQYRVAIAYILWYNISGCNLRACNCGRRVRADATKIRRENPFARKIFSSFSKRDWGSERTLSRNKCHDWSGEESIFLFNSTVHLNHLQRQFFLIFEHVVMD